MSDQNSPPPPVRPQPFTAQVSQHILLAGKYQYIFFEFLNPHRLQFQAGQYVLMTIPGIDKKYSYSIASPPAKDHGMDVLVDISPGGPGSQYLKSLKPGDQVSFLAPVGQFVLADPNSDIGKKEAKLVFVATGSGISAIRSMILDRLEDKSDYRPMTLHWGLRYADEVFWHEDFRMLHDDFGNFTYDLVLSRPPTDWPLCHGRVTDCLVEHHQDFSNTGYYLCGNKTMIEQVTNILLDKGVDKAHIHSEKFY